MIYAPAKINCIIILRMFEFTALQSGSRRKISKYCENELQVLFSKWL